MSALIESRAEMTALSALIATHDAAHAAFVAHGRDVMAPANEAWRAAARAIPHVRTARSYLNQSGDRITLTTEDADSVAVARRILADPPSVRGDDEFYITLAELVDAADKREMEETRLQGQYRIAEIDAEHDRLEAAYGTAWQAVADCPVATLSDWLLKVEFARATECDAADGLWPLIEVAKHLLTEMPA